MCTVPGQLATEIRLFTRADRDQLVELVNAHIAAVVPGWSLPVSALLAQLEREPAEYVVDPWVVDRVTFVAVVRDRLVAAAHLRRYGTDSRVMPDFYDAGEIKWLIGWPHRMEAAHALAKACVGQLEKWGVKRQWASGDLPSPATFGIPDAWPHVRAVVVGAGFSDRAGHDGIRFAGTLDGLAPPGPPPVAGLTVRREVDNLATRFTGLLDGAVVGYVNAQGDLTGGGTVSRVTRWCALRERFVEPAYRRRGIGTWLVRHAIEWQQLGGADRVLVPLGSPHDDPPEFYEQFGWREIGRTRGRWERVPSG
ncbi:MAG TPA: GNAT family N-acetyltransferase [Actinomycetota bacterium]|nr:GNAT family N-acetyltransferase [Actinomycetota bacterium]